MFPNETNNHISSHEVSNTSNKVYINEKKYCIVGYKGPRYEKYQTSQSGKYEY